MTIDEVAAEYAARNGVTKDYAREVVFAVLESMVAASSKRRIRARSVHPPLGW